MGEVKSSFWHELVGTWVTYILVGVCLIPFGVAYALIAVRRPFGNLSDSAIMLIVCLSLGLLFAHLMLRNFTKRPSLVPVLINRQVVSNGFLRLTIGEPIALSRRGTATPFRVVFIVGTPSSKITVPYSMKRVTTNFITYRIDERSCHFQRLSIA
jgi:hypothetical protein